jgi:plastocyanin
VIRKAGLLAAAIFAVCALTVIPWAQGADKADKTTRVKAVDFKFMAKRVTIHKGDRVTWSFKEGRHNVTGKNWKSKPLMRPGTTYSHKFKKVGTYKYQCTIHQPGMDGIVRVVR